LKNYIEKALYKSDFIKRILSADYLLERKYLADEEVLMSRQVLMNPLPTRSMGNNLPLIRLGHCKNLNEHFLKPPLDQEHTHPFSSSMFVEGYTSSETEGQQRQTNSEQVPVI
jgi:hypothetical protein